MRATIAAGLIGLLAITFITATTHAQQRKPMPPAVEVGSTETSESNNSGTERKLEKYLSANFSEAPFGDVLDYVSEETGVETYTNAKVLEAAGVTRETPVTINLKKVRADMLLDLVLEQVGPGVVDYVIRDGILIVTTSESHVGTNEIKAYPIADLLTLQAGGRRAERETPDPPATGEAAAPGESAPAITAPAKRVFLGGSFGAEGFERTLSGDMPENVRQLVNVITDTVAPGTWEDQGGPGTVTYYGDMLIVRHNTRTQREVDKLLKLLRSTAKK